MTEQNAAHAAPGPLGHCLRCSGPTEGDVDLCPRCTGDRLDDVDPDVLNPGLYERVWWTPEGIVDEIDLGTQRCPYRILALGGPKDLPGAYGPGTCIGGCYDEPRCMT